MTISPITNYHICYDAETQQACPTGFTPLRHANKLPHLREIIPILECLSEREWKDDEFVGFFSPKFNQKTGIISQDINNAVERFGKPNQAIIFPHAVGETAFFCNPWEQGEFFNPGILKLSESLIRLASANIELYNDFSTLDNTVFSHFILAKKPFWDEWTRITKIYIKLISSDPALYTMKTLYKGEEFSIHPFVIERVPSMVLMSSTFKSTLYYEHYNFVDNLHIHKAKKLDDLKRNFIRDNDESSLKEYWLQRLLENGVNLKNANNTPIARSHLKNMQIDANYYGISIQ